MEVFHLFCFIEILYYLCPMIMFLKYCLILTCISRFNEGRKGNGAQTLNEEINELINTFIGAAFVMGVVFIIFFILKTILFGF